MTLREAALAATPGPWALNSCLGTDGGDECWQATPHQDIYKPSIGDEERGDAVLSIEGGDDQTIADARYIVALVNAAPALLDERDRLREALRRYIVALDRLNDQNDTDNTVDGFEAAAENLEKVARSLLEAQS